SSLIREGLVDAFHLFINPVAIGSGRAVFGELEQTQHLRLVRSVAFPCGIVGLQYEPVRG
ncbi:MAG TPA: dihydrofolate reductase family protein, partial [Chitinophagaceae bacterium]|nr:dihydrofolate reductase family protein [Chitinophagaceae bacterium]